MVHGSFGDVDTYNIDYIYDTFGKGALMDSYIMDFVIKYWKQDPELGLAYQSGKHVLLSSLFITVNVWCHSFLLHWLFHVHACLHCLFFFSCPFFVLFSLQYVLQMETFVTKDDEGNSVLPVVHSTLVLQDAVNQFKVFVSDDVNLFDAKLVSSLFPVVYFSGLLYFFL